MNTQLGEAVLESIGREGDHRVFSKLFMKIWCGSDQPTPQLEKWLEERGYEIFQNVNTEIDKRQGYRVQKHGQPDSDGRLF